MTLRTSILPLAIVAISTACGERAPEPGAADTAPSSSDSALSTPDTDTGTADTGTADRTAADTSTADVTDADAANARAAADVIRRYYAAIAAHDYRRAYELWGSEGEASGQSFEEFEAGFARTARVEADVGEPGRVEGAAGSRYVEVPVVVRAITRDGERQRFEGSYTLRRTVVEGATPEQQRWHIYSADVARTD